MTKPKGSLDTLMDRLGIRLVPCHRRRLPGQSHARGTMKEIRAAHGEPHLILTLRLIRETAPNKDALWSETIGAVSDILAQRPDWQERPSELFEAFDAIDLNAMRELARQRRPWPIRATVRVMLYVELDLRIGTSPANGSREEGSVTQTSPNEGVFVPRATDQTYVGLTIDV